MLQQQLQGAKLPVGGARGSAEGCSGGSALAAQPTSAVAIRRLPRFDVTLMEHFLDSQRPMKIEVYELFRQHPELLVAEEEGMTKGRTEAGARAVGTACRLPWCD